LQDENDADLPVSKALSTLSQKSATVAENGEPTATVTEFRIQRQSQKTFLRQCGQALSGGVTESHHVDSDVSGTLKLQAGSRDEVTSPQVHTSRGQPTNQRANS